ncbi:hypothetical protein DERP_011654 [Dermatophagoides pteronyssinus]|uniref:MYND-type domain-containing protein n=1 Tax=Dermatophagoides pteronyssinus TaxID=6956 RepID=A0ABQ8JX34_DERPT|nr:hypothetical protein DERP_011654 [Dermatophagoides pteronyssinus]
MKSHRDYQAGEIISISLPFIHVLNKEFKGKNCDYCFVECNELGKCSRCKKMYYCGKDCQQKDWIQHKFECKIYKNNLDQLKVAEYKDDLFVRFVLRSYLYLINSPESFYEKRQLLNDENSAICLANIDIEKLVELEQPRLIRLKQLFKELNLLKIEWNALKMVIYHGLCYDYGLDIFNNKLQHLGIGFYLAESQLKHSCSPNVTTLFNGTQLVMRATRSIKSGEHIIKNRL